MSQLIYSFIPFGYFTYYLTDAGLYNCSDFVHYTSLISGIYFLKRKFAPGAFLLGFHLAHQSYQFFKIK